jgi:hypothetical protein
MSLKRIIASGAVLAVGIVLITVTAVSAQKVTPGSACKVLNQKVVYQNVSFTCISSKKNLVWNTGVAVVKPTPVPTPSSSPISTPDSNQSSNSIPESPTPGETCSRNKNSLKNC